MIQTKEGLIKEAEVKKTVQPSITNEQLKNLVKEVTKVLKNIQK